jgi:hypothetical protein
VSEEGLTEEYLAEFASKQQRRGHVPGHFAVCSTCGHQWHGLRCGWPLPSNMAAAGACECLPRDSK